MTAISNCNHESPRQADTSTMTRLARRSLRELLHKFVHLYADVEDVHLDPVETVHQLRVTSRKSDVALRLFRAWFPRPRWDWMRQTLRKVRHAAGAVRDLDLLESQWQPLRGRLANQVSFDAATWMHDRVRQQRDDAMQRLIKRTRHSARNHVRKRSHDLIRRMKPPARHGAAKGMRHLNRLLEDLQDSIPLTTTSWQNCHRTRIALRRLRYALDFLCQVLSGDTASQCESLAQMQEQLGLMNDDATALRHLREAIETCTAAELVPEYQSLCERFESAARERLVHWHGGELKTLLVDIANSIEESRCVEAASK